VKNVERLLARYETGAIKQALRTLPARIAEARHVVDVHRARVDEAQDRAGLAEAELSLAIAAETNGNGKPAFSNAEARTAELVRRRASDSAWLVNSQGLRAEADDLAEHQGRLDELIDTFRAYRVVARLTAAELALLAEADEDADDVSEVKLDVARGKGQDPF